MWPENNGTLEELRAQAQAGGISRRDVLKRSLALGLSAPVIAALLAACGDDDDDDGGDDAPTATTDAAGGGEPTEAEAEPTEAEGGEEEPTEAEGGEEAEPTEAEGGEEAEPTEPEGGETGSGERGGGGKMTLLYWQAPTIINQHLAQGTKDVHATRICQEPLVDFDAEENPILVLAAEWPSVETETLDPNGEWVIWKLREGVKWHDGEDFTAEDVAFTVEYAQNEDTTATTVESYSGIESVDIIDDLTVRLNFNGPTPNWSDSFNGIVVLPQHILADAVGTAARDHEFNLMPIGTGPFMVREFNPGDVVLYDIFPDYWDPGKPFFDEVEMKGGGDAASAARAVLVTGEVDWAWNLQVEPEILEQMESEGGEGQLVSVPGTSAERIYINFADNRTEVDGAFSEPSTQHPIWQHKEAREALALALRRDLIATQLYGQFGVPTGDTLNVPARFKFNNPWEYNLDAAKERLAAIDFPAAFDNTNLLYQTSVNSVRQKTQEIVKEDLEELGFTVELKSVDSGVFFSSDAGNPDTYGHFYADLEMYTNGPGSPYPIAWAARFRSDEIASKANNWAGSNITRWNNPAFDELHNQAQVEIDEDTQLEIWTEMFALVNEDIVEVPQVWRGGAAAVHNRIANWTPSTWAATPPYDLKNWTLAEE